MRRRGSPSAIVFVQDYTDYTDLDDFRIFTFIILEDVKNFGRYKQINLLISPKIF
jgi:hypothetical protein